MNQEEPQSFSVFLKDLTLPISSFFGIGLFIVEFREKIDLLTTKLIFASLPILCLLWLIYVWSSFNLNKETQTKKIYQHKRIVRWGAIFAFLISLIPIYFLIVSLLPLKVNFVIDNKTKEKIQLKFLNRYNILAIGDNGIEYIVTSGILNINKEEQNSLIIPPNSTKRFFGVIENKSKLESFLNGDFWIDLNIETNNNTRINCDKMLHLTRESLNENNLILYYDTKKQ